MFTLQLKPRALIAMVGSGDLNGDVPVILVIEGEEAIQSLVEDALTEGGFEPAIAAPGEEAVTLLKGRTGNYRALVTDISLCGRIDGWEVAKQAREIDPQFPIVYMSGASADDWALQRRSQQHHVIQAVRAGSLVTAVSNLLNTGTPTA